LEELLDFDEEASDISEILRKLSAAAGNYFKLETKRSKARCPGRRLAGFCKEPHPGSAARHPDWSRKDGRGVVNQIKGDLEAEMA